MSKWCAFSTEDQKKVDNNLTERLQNYLEANDVIDPIGYMQEFYKERLKKSDNVNLAYKLTATIPAILRILASYEQYKDQLSPLIADINTLENKVKDSKEYLTDIVDTENYVSDIFNLTDEEQLQNVLNNPVVLYPINDYATQARILSYRPSGLFTTTGNQIDPNEFRYNVLNKLGQLFNQYPNMNVDGVTNGIKATIMLANRFAKYLPEDQKLSVNIPIVAITDGLGEPIYFDEKYNITSEQYGVPIYYQMRSSDKDKRQTIDEFANTISKQEGVPIAEAKQRAEEQYKLEEDQYKLILAYLEKNPDALIPNKIIGVSRGMIYRDAIRTKHFFNNINEPFDITTLDYAGKLYVNIPNISDPIEVYSEVISERKAQDIATMLLEDIYVEDEFGEVKPVEDYTIVELLKSFVYSDDSTIGYKYFGEMLEDPKTKKFARSTKIKINYKDYNIETEKDKTRQAIINQLTKSYLDGTPTNLAVYRQAVKMIKSGKMSEQVAVKELTKEINVFYNWDSSNHRPFILGSIEIPETELNRLNTESYIAVKGPALDRLNMPLDNKYVLAGLVTINDQIYVVKKLSKDSYRLSEYNGTGHLLHPSKGTIHKIVKQNSNPNKDLYGKVVNDFTIEKIGDKNMLIVTPTPYTTILKDSTYTYATPDKNGKLTALNGYVKYAPSIEAMEKIKDDVEGKTDRPKLIGLSDEDYNKILGIKIKYKNKLQKSQNQQVEDKAIKEVAEWYNSKKVEILEIDAETGKTKVKKTTFSKIWPLSNMMHAINQGNPNSVASFTDYGVTLWKGSDMTDLYHEAWHGFTQNLLSDEQREGLYKELEKANISFTNSQGKRTTTKKANTRELEEFLAEQFREYALSKGSKKVESKLADAPIRKNIFKKLWDLLYALFNKTEEVDVLLAPSSIPLIKEMYDKLYKGDLSEYFVVKNEQTQLFNHEIIPVTKNMELLSYDDTNLVIQSIDYLLSEFIKVMNAKEGTKRFTGTLHKTTGLLHYAYKNVYIRFGDNIAFYASELEKLNAKIDSLTEEEKDTYVNYANRLRILKIVYNDFGSNHDDYTANENGYIAYHLKKSKFISFEERLTKEDDTEATVKFDRSPNDESVKSRSSEQTMYLLRNLVLYNKGKQVINDLGFPQLVELDDAYYYLAVLLQNNISGDDIYNRLLESSKSNTPTGSIARQTLELIGTNFAKEDAEQTMWTAFITDFDKARIDLRTTSYSFDKNGVLTWKTRIANIQDSKIKGRFEGHFRSVDNNPYMLVGESGNYLDTVNLLKKYAYWDKTENKYKPKLEIIKSNPMQFLTDFGISLTDNTDIRMELVNNTSTLGFIINGLAVNSGANKNNGIPTVPINSVKLLLTNEGTPYSLLIDTEIAYGDSSKTLMVSSATNSMVYLHSDKSSATNMVDGLKSVVMYDDLKDIPYLSHLHTSRNPLIKGNMILEAMFDFSKGANGIKKPNAELVFQYFSGIELRNHEHDYWLTGMDAFGATELDRLQSDIETFMFSGIIIAGQNGDKKLTPSIYMDTLDADSLSTKAYIAPDRFAVTGDEGWKPKIKAIMIKKIEGELNRILELRAVTKKGRKTNVYYNTWISGITDKSFGDLGSEFQGLKDILSAPVRKQLYNLSQSEINMFGDLRTYLAKNNKELLKAIFYDIEDYFDKKSDAFVARYKPLQNYNNYISEATKSTFLKKINLNKQLSIDRTKTSQITDVIIKAYWVNQFIHNYEITTLFYGDPGLYNHTKDEFLKRNNGLISTGLFPRFDMGFISYINDKDIYNTYINSAAVNVDKTKLADNYLFDGTWNSAIMEDPVSQSIYLDEMITEYAEYLVDKGINEKEAKVRAKEKYKNYANMEEADGQGWITLPAYKILSLGIGEKWSSEQDELYDKIIAGKYVDTDTVLKYFPVKKMQYWGPLKTNGLPIIAMHKFSLMPLIPNVIKGKNLEILHNRMIEQNIHYSLLRTGSKIANVSSNGIPADLLYKDIKERTLHLSNDNYKFTPNVIFSQYFKEQVATNAEFKSTVTLSTQLKKLVEIGLYEYGVPVDYRPEIKGDARKELVDEWEALPERDKNSESRNYVLSQNYITILNKLITKLKANFRQKYGLTADNQIEPGGTITNLIEKIRESLTNKEIADIELEGIALNDLKEGMKYDLSLSVNAIAIEKILMSIVEKKIIKPKMYGEALIMASTSLFEDQDHGTKLRAASAEELKAIGTDDLPFYQRGRWSDFLRRSDYTNADTKGKPPTTAMKVKVALSGDFRKLLYLKDIDGIIFNKKSNPLEALNKALRNESWLDKGNHRRMITMAAVRIPVQGSNSMEFMEVYQFLPENMGNIIVLPSEIVAKSGGDFDIDKLTILMPSIGKYGKNVDLVSSAEADQPRSVLKDREKALKQIIKEAIQKIKDEKLTNVSLSLVERQERDERLENDKLELEDVKFKLDMGSVKGLQNDLIHSLRLIMENPNNYIALTVPNSTDILKLASTGNGKDILALENYNRDYHQGVVFRPEDYDNLTSENLLKKGITPTNIFTPEYNAAKRLWNNIGLEALGIGATENTIHVAYTKVGLHLNLFKLSASGLNRYAQRLAVPHNSVPYIQSIPLVNVHEDGSKDIELDENGNWIYHDVQGRAISMASLTDKSGMYNISEIISQAINGWVDIAKDSWIFDIQGSKAVSPTLMFLIHAGVNPYQAIYLCSQPLVLAYIKAKIVAGSMRADQYGMPQTDRYWEAEANARNYMYRDPAIKAIMDKYIPDNPRREGDIGNWEFELGGAAAALGLESAVTMDNLKHNIVANKGLQHAEVNEDSVRILMHFMQIEDMTAGLAKVKNKVQGFDTKQQTTLQQLSLREFNVDSLEDKTVIPGKFLERLLTITAGAQSHLVGVDNPLNMYRNIMDLRTNPVLLNYINNNLIPADFTSANAIIGASYYPDRDQLNEGFINNLVPFIFQNTINYSTSQGAVYKTLAVEDSTPLAVIPNKDITVPAFVKNNVIYINNAILKAEYTSRAYANPEVYVSKIGDYSFRYAPINVSHAFRTLSDYKHYVMERELLRSIYLPDHSYQEDYEYKLALVKEKKINSTKTYPLTTKEVEYKAFEVFLRNKAMHNIFNVAWLFNSDNSYADKFSHIKNTLKLKDSDFSIFKHLEYMSADKLPGEAFGQRNIAVTAILDSKMVDNFVLQLNALGNPNHKKVDDPAINKFISDMFKNFSIYAYLQSGTSTSGYYGISRLINDPARLYKIMDKTLNNYKKKLNNNILSQYASIFFRLTSSTNRSVKNKAKDWRVNDESQINILKGYLSIAGLERVHQKGDYFIKDAAMASNSTKAIAKYIKGPNPAYNSSTNNYLRFVDGNPASFNAANIVWVFGAGVFPNQYAGISKEKWVELLNKEFNKFYIPKINEALAAGVKKFNVGTATGIDSLTVNYLISKGFIGKRIIVPGIANRQEAGYLEMTYVTPPDAIAIKTNDIDTVKTGRFKLNVSGPALITAVKGLGDQLLAYNGPIITSKQTEAEVKAKDFYNGWDSALKLRDSNVISLPIRVVRVKGIDRFDINTTEALINYKAYIDKAIQGLYEKSIDNRVLFGDDYGQFLLEPLIGDAIGKIKTNIISEWIFSGRAVSTIRTDSYHKEFYKGDGIYTVSNGKKAEVKYYGLIRHIGNIIKGDGFEMSLEEFAIKEGFGTWANFVTDSKYSEDFIKDQEGKVTRHFYNIKPAKGTIGAYNIDAFNYLSQQLYDKFEYVNKNYKLSVVGSLVEDVTNKDVIEFIKANKTTSIVELLVPDKQIIYAEDVARFHKYLKKSVSKPEEFFTEKTRFTEFYSNDSGLREHAPETTKWLLQTNGYYNLVDKITGEVFIENVDLLTGRKMIPHVMKNEVEEEPAEVIKPKLPSNRQVIKNEKGLIIINNAIPLEQTQQIVASNAKFIENTSFKQTGGSVSWGWGMQWMRSSALTDKQKEGVQIGKQKGGQEVTQEMVNELIKGTPANKIKGLPLYVYTTYDKNGNSLPNIPSNIITMLAEQGIDVSQYDASYNSVYDKNDKGSLIVHQDNTEFNTSPIITVSLGRPMKFITYQLKDSNDYSFGTNTKNKYELLLNTISNKLTAQKLAPELKRNNNSNVIAYGELTPGNLAKYAKMVGEESAALDVLANSIEKIEEQILTNGAILVFSKENRNVFHEIIFDTETDALPMPSGFPELTINKAYKGLGHQDRMVKTNDYRVVFTLRKVTGTKELDIINTSKLTTQSKAVTSNINFIEDQTGGYPARTKINASADATIHLAIDFETPGEKLTKKSVNEQGKVYIALNATSLKVTPERVNKLIDIFNSKNVKTLNIAGNGIYDMKSYTQQQVDDFTYRLLKEALKSPRLNNKIESIRSGGQTGFDEAGAKAGIKLGIPTIVLAPKNWEFRTNKGNIKNEEEFKARFTTQSKVSVSEGIEINSKVTGLGNDLTNVHYGKHGISAFDIVPSDKTLVNPVRGKGLAGQTAWETWGESVEAWYKSNNAKSKGIPEGSEGDAYDMKLMIGLITDKLNQYPNLVAQIKEKGGLPFLEKSTHTMGVDRWSSKNPKNMFMVALKQAYQNVTSSTIKYQNLTKESDENIRASEKTIRDLAARMSDRIGIKYKFISDRSQEYKGKIENGIAYVNLAYATLDTPIHEILGHPIIRVIKEGKQVLDRYKDAKIEKTNVGWGIIGNWDQIHDEFMTKELAEDYLKNQQLDTSENTKKLYQNLLKELEYGKGKEVLDRIKKDYKYKTTYKEENTTSFEEEKNILSRGFILERIDGDGEPVYRKYDEYTLEEQQEEAIVELLGLMTAEKLDNVKDGKLISLLKRLLKEMKAFVKQLLGQREIEIDKLPDNMTLGDLSDLLAYSNSKLILPGYQVEYTTPDNMKFKTYTEANNHISELAKNVKDLDLSNFSLDVNKNNNPYNLVLDKPYYTSDSNFLVFVNSDKINHYRDFPEYKNLEKGNYYEYKFIPSKYTYEFAKVTSARVQQLVDNNPGLYIGASDELKNADLDKIGIRNFIEKNKEYEQSKEIIEEWKKVNNIQYNPEEIYSKGQEFSSVVGAYSDFDVTLMMQNLLHHIEDNEKAGGKFAVSAYTKPIDKQISHLEGGGGKIKFKIYPQSNDILWAANTDVYSGSVWDASSKINKDKKSELLGVSYTKYPSLTNINSVQPNLADVVDNLYHHHNELGIILTGNNFRLEYDENIPYSTKKIINGINSILDQRYGKLVKPDIKKVQTQFKIRDWRISDAGMNEGVQMWALEYTTAANAFDDMHGNLDFFTSEQEARDYLNNMIELSKGFIGIRPTQTGKTLKESIYSVRSKLGITKNKVYFRHEEFSVGDIVTVKDHEGKYKIYEVDKMEGEIGIPVHITEVFFNLESLENDFDPETNPDGLHPLFNVPTEFLTIYEDPNIKEKEYTSQALINTKIAALKEVAKKYPRSLIRSEVKSFINSSSGYDYSDDVPFQKLSSTIPSPKTKFRKGIPELFESNPELANAVYEALGFSKDLSSLNPVYSAKFLANDEEERLRKLFPAVFPNTYYHHSTIEFKPKDISNLEFGSYTPTKIIGRITTDKVDALLIENPKSKNKYPHITLSTAEGVKPFESNAAFENNSDKIEYFDKPITVYTVEGIFNGQKDITSLTQPKKNLLKSKEKFGRPRIILPIGISGSGKSTWIQSLPKEQYEVVSPDNIRKELTGSISDQTKNKEVFQEVDKRIDEALKNNKQVILDATNLNTKLRREFTDKIKSKFPNAKLEYKKFDVNAKLSKERIKADLLAKKDRSAVPDDVIDRQVTMYNQALEDIKSEPITEFSDEIQSAVEFARKAHGEQKRKYTGRPYYTHLEDVASKVAEYTDDKDIITAALLHDTIEDTDVTYDQIKDKFGKRVADIVQDLSDEFTKDKYPDLNRKQRKEKEAERLSKTSDEAKLIKAADKLHNIQDIAENDPKFAVKYLQEAKDDADAIKSSSPLYKKLQDKITEIQDWLNTIKLEEPISELGLTPEQKQQAQSKFQEYVNATGKQDVEGFKNFTTQSSTGVKEGIKELFDSLTEFTPEQKVGIIANFTAKHKMTKEAAIDRINMALQVDPQGTINKLKECY